MGGKKSISLCPFWRFDNWLLFGKTRPCWGELDRKKGFFNPLLMRKHDFWQVQWYLNGQKWGVKKASLYVHFEGLTTNSYLAKQDPVGGSWIEKKAFLTLFWWENMISDRSSCYLMVKNRGLKKASLYVHFEGFTTNSYFGKTRPRWGRLDRNKGFFNPLLMRKHDFWHVQWYLNGQKWGVKKSISVWPFWRFDNWLLFGKTRPPWEELDRKRGFFNPLPMRKHDFWHVQWYLNGQKWGVKKSISVWPFWRFDNWLLFGKTRPPWEELDRKRGFFNPLLMRKHDFWQVQWYLNGQKWGVKKSISVWPFWRFDNWLLFGKTRPPGGSWIEKKAFLTLFWWENMISDRSSGI